MSAPPRESDARTVATRRALLDAAERLFAEQGVGPVSGRRIAQAAGQRNTTAVSYHFGGKTDLIRAISERHAAAVDTLRAPMLADLGPDAALRDWVRCLVLPITVHFAELDTPSWYARCAAQIQADPALREIVNADAVGLAQIQAVRTGLMATVPDLPAAVRTVRSEMARHLIVTMCAEHERRRAEAEGRSVAPDWADLGADLVDAIVAIYTAPTSRPGSR